MSIISELLKKTITNFSKTILEKLISNLVLKHQNNNFIETDSLKKLLIEEGRLLSSISHDTLKLKEDLERIKIILYFLSALNIILLIINIIAILKCF